MRRIGFDVYHFEYRSVVRTIETELGAECNDFARHHVTPNECSARRKRFTLRRLNSQDYRKDFDGWGRGFSINQVQNGDTDPLWMVDLSARFVLSAPKTPTLSEPLLIGTASGSPAGSFMLRVRTTMTTIAFIPTGSSGLAHDR
jgi:hypothetical protein